MKNIFFAIAFFSTIWNVTKTLAQPKSSLLWKISGNGLQQNSYLLFTSSSCDETIKLSNKVEKVLQTVKVVALEDNRADKSNLGKLQQAVLAQSDTQKIKNVLSATEYQQFVKKIKDEGAPDQAIDQLNNLKVSIILKLLQASASLCEIKTPERIEDVLKKYATKNKIEYKELFSEEEVIRELDDHAKEYWNNNIIYSLNNSDLIKQSLQNRLALYGDENLPALKELYETDNFFELTYNDIVNKKHIDLLATRIDTLVKEGASLIALNISNATPRNNSIIDILKAKSYLLTPIVE